MLVNDNGGIARNISGDLFLSLFVDKASKATHINIVSIAHIGFHNGEERLNGGRHIALVYTCFFCNLVDNV